MRIPFTIAVASWLFVATGCIGIVAGAMPITGAAASGQLASIDSHTLADAGWASGSGVIAVLAGAFMLRGANWARWVCAAWMAAHIGLSMLHSLSRVAVHLVIFGMISYAVFLTPEAAFFYGKRGANAKRDGSAAPRDG